jgi:diguanylate cyclase (GGDEF)-like protein
MGLGLPSSLTSLYVQIFGTLLFCMIFLFLWSRSGIVYFRFWSLAWAVQSAALLSAYIYFLTGAAVWLAPYAFFEFAFALSLVAAARVGPSSSARSWASVLKMLVGFPLFLLLAYLLGLYSDFQGYHALHALVVGWIYLYSYLTMRGHAGMGGRLFRFSLLCLSIAFFHHAGVFFYIHVTHGVPIWARYLQFNNLYDFALQILLAFSAMAMWIENQGDRLRDLNDELDRVRRETQTSIDLDGLTGLLNQSALATRMDNPDKFAGVVAVCDMDNFKELNDRYGHLVGDEILRNVGHLLQSSIRQEDDAFRWGGDEFVILFGNQNLPVVQSRMQSIQQRLRDFRVRGYGMLPISFSWGTAECAGDSLREALDRADHEMYAFKRARSHKR